MPQNCSVSHILQNIFLCVPQKKRHSYRFGTTWGWVNDDRIFIFGWTILLNFILSRKCKNVVCFCLVLLFTQKWCYDSHAVIHITFDSAWNYILIIIEVQQCVWLFCVSVMFRKPAQDLSLLSSHLWLYAPLNWLNVSCRPCMKWRRPARSPVDRKGLVMFKKKYMLFKSNKTIICTVCAVELYIYIYIYILFFLLRFNITAFYESYQWE